MDRYSIMNMEFESFYNRHTLPDEERQVLARQMGEVIDHNFHSLYPTIMISRNLDYTVLPEESKKKEEKKNKRYVPDHVRRSNKCVRSR